MNEQISRTTINERLDQTHGVERLGVHLSFMRKRPGMFFGESPSLMAFHNFLVGIHVAESCYEVPETLFSLEGFPEWLKDEKNFPESNLGWRGMISNAEPDNAAQLKLAIDLVAEYASIPLLDEADVW